MFKNILIPTDGSPFARKAVVKGVALAKSVGAKVTGMFAAPPATPIIYRNSLPIGYAMPGDHEKIVTKAASEHLDFVARAARKAGVSYHGVLVTSDYPEDEILKAAKKNGCDLIVMATHGQGGLRGLFIGSVTQKVLAKSTIPVMVFRSGKQTIS